MRKNAVYNENIIRGNCSLFVCSCCRTKYGWEHQVWCEHYAVTVPSCRDCRYYRQQDGVCEHLAKKLRKETLAYEKAQDSV